MRFNHFSIIDKPFYQQLQDLCELGFQFDRSLTYKALLSNWLLIAPVDPTSLAVSSTQTVSDFLASDEAGNRDLFYGVGLQLLGFVANFDFQFATASAFAESLNLPLVPADADWTRSETLVSAIYLLLNSRHKKGMTLVELWVSEGLLPLDHHHHFFNDKALATFDTSQLIREVVYIESPVDTQGRGSYDLIKAEIIRPQAEAQLPVILTASPYHFGTNDSANDAKLHDMTGDLADKTPACIDLTLDPLVLPDYPHDDLPAAPNNQATEHFTHAWTYSLNDYFLARGFASIYVGSVGTRGSDGFQSSGDYQQIAGVTAVIDWLNGRARAFTSRQKRQTLTADWATGRVAMTGKSYLGTLAYGAATTGIEGLEVILAEAGISNWYDYYRENGLVRSPGGFPGEDLDVLAEWTYSRNLEAADFLAHNASYQHQLTEMSQRLDRDSGDVNRYWQARNYLPNAEQVKADVLIVHGLQDFNVTPSHAFQFWHALPDHVTKHAFLHQGSHIYINQWQSLDFSETINAYFSAKLLDRDLTLDLPPIIWQANGKAQTFESLSTFGGTALETLPLGCPADPAADDPHDDDDGANLITFQNAYAPETFDRYGQDFHRFKADLFTGKANAAIVDLQLPQAVRLNGQIVLELALKVTDHKGLLSAQVLDFGPKQRLADTAALLEPKTLDRGRNFMLEDLRELPLVDKPYQVVTKGFLNLQNRQSLTEINSVVPNDWFTVTLALQPTIYEFEAGDTLRLILYSTDFEHTIRDNRAVTYDINLDKSRLYLPKTK
ncbi:MAG: Xaa-Pro dipeptidyl-peptidase [Streptococcaceae bacterium]|nr:Xaa-Pro dipeptidyl-peptidase [Streptococcaceae bacterium]